MAIMGHLLSYLLPAYLAFGLSALASPIQAQPCSDVPSLNQRILDYVNRHMGRKVGRGECWDLAADALNTYGARWDGRYGFGREVDPRKECIYPGDIVQFRHVVIVEQLDGGTRTQTMPQHTAIVHEVFKPGVYKIAHQNNAFSGKKVGLSLLDLSEVRKGKITFYRPVQN